MNARVRALIRKEFAQMLRDKVVLLLVLFLATAELAMCTLALGFDVKNLSLAVIDQDRSVASRALVRELTSGDNFILRATPRSFSEARSDFRKGNLDALIEIPPNFGVRLAAGRQSSIGVVVDGSNATVAARARAYIIEITASLTQKLGPGTSATATGVQPAVRIWYNAELTNTAFMALSMLAQAGFILAVILPAAGMVREKQNGTLEQIRVTPIRAHELFIGKVVPPLVIVLGSLFPSLLVIRLMGVPVSGSVSTLFLFQGLFLISGLAIGIFVATLTSTLQQALLASFFGLFPLLFLSGFVAPVETMPVWLQVGAQANPLLHDINIVTGIFLKGAGLTELWRHGAALAAISASLFVAAWAIFRRAW